MLIKMLIAVGLIAILLKAPFASAEGIPTDYAKYKLTMELKKLRMGTLEEVEEIKSFIRASLVLSEYYDDSKDKLSLAYEKPDKPKKPELAEPSEVEIGEFAHSTLKPLAWLDLSTQAQDDIMLNYDGESIREAIAKFAAGKNLKEKQIDVHLKIEFIQDKTFLKFFGDTAVIKEIKRQIIHAGKIKASEPPQEGESQNNSAEEESASGDSLVIEDDKGSYVELHVSLSKLDSSS